MRKIIFCVFIGICLYHCCYAWQVEDKKSAKVIDFEKQNSQLIKYLKKQFVYIKSHSYNVGYFEGSDSVNLKPNLRRISVVPFYLSKHETSVAEYMEFCKVNNGIYDSVALYPQIDNLQDFPYASLETYLENKKYHNYPIIGVNKEQAMAYCKWFSDMIMKKYDLSREKGYVFFMLPTKAFFEAAVSSAYIKNEEFSYSDNNQPGASYGLYANYTENGNSISKLSNTKSNKSPHNKFYNLLGNVAEWCLDSARDLYSVEKQNDKYIKTNQLIFRVPISLKNNIDYSGLVTGGAYNLGSFYLQPAVTIPLNSDKGYSWVGFRPACLITIPSNSSLPKND